MPVFFFFFLENPMDRGACWATVGGVAKNRTRLTMNKQTPSVRNFIISKYRHKMTVEGTSLVVQWLRYHTLSEENPGSISGQGTRFHMPQLRVLMLQQGSKISHAATKTQSNQINTYNNDFFFEWLLRSNKSQIYKKIFMLGTGSKQCLGGLEWIRRFQGVTLGGRCLRCGFPSPF